MRPGDLAAVVALADRIHPELPEITAIFAERLALFPDGCLVLAATGRIAGYAIAHPIFYPHAPPLNTFLGSVAADADAFYIHDVAIAPEARGRGHADAIVKALLDIARTFPRSCLISVYGTVPFWQRFGFVDARVDWPLDKLADYGADARFMVRLTQD